MDNNEKENKVWQRALDELPEAGNTPSPPPLKCYYCDARFWRDSSLQHHINYMHNSRGN